MNRKIFLFLFIFFAILIKPLYTEEFGIIQKKEVVVLFENSLEFAAKEVADIYPALKKELEKTFKWNFNFKAKVLLIKNSKKFQMITGSNLIVGIAIPKRYEIIINYSEFNKHPFAIKMTLKHEMCHLLLHHYIRRDNLPKWLDEGICQWISGGLGEIIMNKNRPVLSKAILKGEYISLRYLTNKFPKDKNSLLLAYEESRSLVEYINSKFGKNGILNILRYMKDGDEVDVAILKSLSISFEELEKKWHTYLRKKFTWITYLTYLGNHLYEILFFLSALLAICAFIKLLMKKRAYEDGDEDNI
jgi:hypothetical protein